VGGGSICCGPGVAGDGGTEQRRGKAARAAARRNRGKGRQAHARRRRAGRVSDPVHAGYDARMEDFGSGMAGEA